jgi:NitT/TauT family transport system permease protein
MLPRRIYQFCIIYLVGLAMLFAIKYMLGLSNYVIPSPREVWSTGCSYIGGYVMDVLDTLAVAVLGHVISIGLATLVGVIGRLTSWLGSFIRLTAYNIQAYPIVAVAPIIFILLGDGLSSRLLITAMICYFPLLLSFIGVFSEPVSDIEHFYTITGRMNWRLELRIRVFENISKLVTVIAGSATVAVVGTIVAEFIASDAGIGYRIRIALYQSDLAKILVALFLIGIFTSLYLFCLEWLGYRVRTKWGLVKGEAQ